MDNFEHALNSHETVANSDHAPIWPTVWTWPSLDSLGLDPDAKQARRSFIGGSDANIILSGDSGRIVRLWREKRGEVNPEELGSCLPVMLGCWTEPFNRQWFERISGDRITGAGMVLTCARNSWRTCTLDGRVAATGAIWKAKHTSAFVNGDEVLARYMPQLQHNMAVAAESRAVLSVIFGNQKFEIIEIAADWLYQLELLEAEADFWDCVQTGRLPVPAEPPPAPKALAVREICLDGNNTWASAAFDWLEHREAAKTHAAATIAIKQLVEGDVKRAFGHGIEARRSKSGAITIKASA